MIRSLRLFRAVAVVFSAVAASGQQIAGEVVSVYDGDTLTVLDTANQQRKIRLAGIDAPEARQDFGKRAKQHLSQLVFRRSVTLEGDKVNRHGRAAVSPDQRAGREP